MYNPIYNHLYLVNGHNCIYTYIGNAGVIIDDLCAHGELGHHKFGTLHDLARNKSRD